LAIAAFLISGATFAQTTWTLDKSHAKLGFTVTHLLISEVDGYFNDFDAKFTASKEDLTDAKIELTAQIASINTGNADRDKHLTAPDFFDAAKFSNAFFSRKNLPKSRR
jgi:polyisoprenoid-binding protein YceI